MPEQEGIEASFKIKALEEFWKKVVARPNPELSGSITDIGWEDMGMYVMSNFEEINDAAVETYFQIEKDKETFNIYLKEKENV